MDVLLKVEGLSKSFPGVQALDHVDLEIRKGEVHGLIGENGAGKSTLIKIMAGAYHMDSGTMSFDGRPYNPPNPTHALDHGIAVVYQELSLCENMSVAENLFINRHPLVPHLKLIDRRALYRGTSELLKKFDLNIQPGLPVKELALAVKEQVEILRALSYGPRLLILDEPTGPLSKPLVERLFELLSDLKGQGVSILYISHNIGEVLRICDRITVLRDGVKVETLESLQADEERLAGMMVGRKIGQLYPARTGRKDRDTVLKVEGLSSRGLFENLNFDLRRGEILGVTGLIGAGRSETAMTLFGAIPKSAGNIYLEGQKVDIRSPGDAIARGIAYLPEDRKLLGLFLSFTISENILSIKVPDYSRFGLVSRSTLLNATVDLMKRLQIKASGPSQVVFDLSGGNQQKTLLAKWISLNPKVLIIDEPTRGIDVGAKQSIHALIRGLSDQGMAVMMISSELPEILGLSDRILVMDRGQIVDFVDNTSEITEEHIMNAIVQFKRGENTRESHTSAQHN